MWLGPPQFGLKLILLEYFLLTIILFVCTIHSWRYSKLEVETRIDVAEDAGSRIAEPNSECEQIPRIHLSFYWGKIAAYTTSYASIWWYWARSVYSRMVVLTTEQIPCTSSISARKPQGSVGRSCANLGESLVVDRSWCRWRQRPRTSFAFLKAFPKILPSIFPGRGHVGCWWSTLVVVGVFFSFFFSLLLWWFST